MRTLFQEERSCLKLILNQFMYHTAYIFHITLEVLYLNILGMLNGLDSKCN